MRSSHNHKQGVFHSGGAA